MAIFALYFWVMFISAEPVPYHIELVTVIVTGIAAAAGIVSRAITALPGAFIRSLLSYLLLIAAITLLLHDTGAILSPYIFIWPLVAAFAGLFGIWSSVPVFLITCAYFAMLLIDDMIEPGHFAPTALIALVPIIFSVIVWSHARQLTDFRRGEFHKRSAADYKKRPATITNLIDQSEMILNALGDSILAIDSRGIVQFINPQAQTLLGWSKQDALTLQYQSVVKLTTEEGEPLADATHPIEQSLNANQETRARALELETKAGKKLFVSLVASPLGDPGSGIIIIMRDITKELSEEREQAEFISTASHEMRTPVASIEGYLGLALNPNTATVDEKAREFITKAQESARHLGRLFQDLLDVSKAEDGRLTSNPEVLDIVSFVGDVVEAMQPKATEKGLALRYKPMPADGEKGERSLTPIYYANLDRDHVRELISNLTENAIKYTPSGEVSLDVVGDNETITISITDSGVGIPAEDIPHLFQKFYRVDSTDTREIGGTGLGLYLSRRLAEALDGRIKVESVHGKGSTFSVELPRLDNATAQRMLAEQKKQEPTPAPVTPEPEATPQPPTPTPPPSPQPAPPLPTPAAPQPQPGAATSPLPISPPAPAPAPAPVPTQSSPPTPLSPPTPASPAAPGTIATPLPVSPPRVIPVASSAPSPSPSPSPTPTPITVQPPATMQPAPPPSSMPAQATQTLASIEQNPAAYQAARDHTATTAQPPVHDQQNKP